MVTLLQIKQRAAKLPWKPSRRADETTRVVELLWGIPDRIPTPITGFVTWAAKLPWKPLRRADETTRGADLLLGMRHLVPTLDTSVYPVRKDGHHPIILMQCGPIRHRITMRQQREATNVIHSLTPKMTDFSVASEEPEIGIQALYGALASCNTRNEQIFDDVLHALEAGRSPLILTERVGHLELLAERLERFARNVVVLRGGRGQKKNREALEKLAAVPDNEECVLIATGRYIGEGFDDARLDTLFLTMPISWKGMLQQYVGRLHRQHGGKHEVRVYDYVDQKVPVLRRMYERRLRGYKAMGYTVAADEHSI